MSERMSARDARTFERGASTASTVAVLTALNGRCDCQPYTDVFTYKRWQALGYQVQRGERAIRVPLVIEKTRENAETGETENVRMMRRSALFCRHQVRPVEADAGADS